MDAAFKLFFLVCIIVLAVLTFFCLVRTIKGPRLVDRIVGTNMIGTMTIAIVSHLKYHNFLQSLFQKRLTVHLICP